MKAEKEAAAAEEEEYGEYYDEEEEAEQEETKEEVKADPAAAIEREREELKVPAAERELIAKMSDIERQIVAKQEEIAKNKKDKAAKDKDFGWWRYDDPATYFCVSTTSRYSFAPGQQIFTSYGRRSNKYLLTFYGFCISDNRHDSVVMRIRRRIDADSRLTLDGIVEQLVLSNEEIETGCRREIELERQAALDPAFAWPAGEEALSEATKGVQLKHNKLSQDLLAYLRAHCLLFYPGEDICGVKMTVPTETEYEIMVLKAYRALLDRFKALNPGRFDA